MTLEIAILRRAREIISDPAKWTQGAFARDSQGSMIPPNHTAACSWCAIGALSRAAFELKAPPGFGAGALDMLGALRPLNDINDEEGHAAVLDLFDKALEEIAQ